MDDVLKDERELLVNMSVVATDTPDANVAFFNVHS